MPIDEITVDVSGYPPVKNEASSMFGARHKQAPYVRTLLEAVQIKLAGVDFHPFTGPIGLEVVLRVSVDQDPWDATNYLGGIADVLQDKGYVLKYPNMTIDLPADLMKVAVYLNDRQIEEVHYRQESSSSSAYSVCVWCLI